MRAEDADGKPIRSESVERYLKSKFGPDLRRVREAMRDLVHSIAPAYLQAKGFAMYEKFRPGVPEGVSGSAAAGELNIERIKSADDKAHLPGPLRWL